MAHLLSACRTPTQHGSSISRRYLANLAWTPWLLGDHENCSSVWDRSRAGQLDRPLGYDCPVKIRSSCGIRSFLCREFDSVDCLCERMAFRQRSPTRNGSPFRHARELEALHKPM